MNKEIKSRLFSILTVSLFLIIMTAFVYLPKQENFLSSLAFLQGQKAFYMQELSSGILLKDAYPTPDKYGLKNDPYSFKVVNNTNHDITYNIIFANNEAKASEKGMEILKNKYLRYSLSNINDENLEANTLSDNGLLLTTTVKAKSEESFNLRLWLDYNSDNGVYNKIFVGFVKIEEVK